MLRRRWRGLMAVTLAITVIGAFRLFGAAEPGELRWFKGNLHTHSLWSDGNDYPDMIVDWYRRADYHFLGLSDHNILAQTDKWVDSAAAEKRGAIGGLARYRERFGDEWVQSREQDGKTQIRLKTYPELRSKFEESQRFLLIQSSEISDSFASKPIHINAHNLRMVVRPQHGDSVRNTIANNLAAVEAQSRATGQPMLAHVNHPNFGYGVTAEDLAAVTAEKFFEVYNGHPGVNQLGDENHVSIERLWDIANTIRLGLMHAAPLYGLATDDSHNYFGDRGSSPGRGWVMVRASKLTPDDLIAAMQRGEFYASSGVTLQEITFDKQQRELRVKIEPVEGCTFQTSFIGAVPPTDQQLTFDNFDRDAKWLGQELANVTGTEASYRLRGNELYVRAVVTSSAAPVNPSYKGQFQQAWTQPVGWSVGKE